MTRLSKAEEQVLTRYRQMNNAAWDEDISVAAEVAEAGETSQHDAKDFRAQVLEMRTLKKNGARHSDHFGEFGYVRTRCICDQQLTHPSCRVCR